MLVVVWLVDIHQFFIDKLLAVHSTYQCGLIGTGCDQLRGGNTCGVFRGLL